MCFYRNKQYWETGGTMPLPSKLLDPCISWGGQDWAGFPSECCLMNKATRSSLRRQTLDTNCICGDSGAPCIMFERKAPFVKHKAIWWPVAWQLGECDFNLCSDVSLCVSVSSLVQLPQHPARPGSQLLPCTLQLEKLGQKMSECIWKGWTARGRRWDMEFDTFLLLSLFFITSLSEVCPLTFLSQEKHYIWSCHYFRVKLLAELFSVSVSSLLVKCCTFLFGTVYVKLVFACTST